MNPALWVAKTGLDAQQTRMSVVANNLANVNTTGFKKDRAKFEDLVYQTVREAGGQSSQNTRLPSGLMLGTGVRVASTEKMHTQGNMVQTGNSLDVAINGRGFLQVLQPDGSVAYTRDGSLQIDDQGRVVTKNGLPVQPGLTIPNNAQSITIGSDGTVTAQVPGSSQPQQVGNIQLADFINPAGLKPVGDNLFVESGASGAAQTGTPGLNGLGSVQQGSLESSNVNIAEELVNMIETQRAFETNTRAVSSTDKMLQFITNNI
ncbi:MAG TPA: flagellar basal-body rod protein FlgG [Gammaproteobacteria bacterium]|nr:flagellar basal-body rod protein FlgG [Gammaproteobacteria bacterium]